MPKHEISAAKPCTCSECGGRARLFLYPGKYAGIWECTNLYCGASDSCEHDDRRIETTQVDYWPTPDIDHSYEIEVYVCNNCNSTVPLEIADPAQDEAEADADRQLDYASNK